LIGAKYGKWKCTFPLWNETASKVSSVFSGNVAWQGFNNYLFPGKIVNSLFGTEYWKKQKTLRYIAE